MKSSFYNYSVLTVALAAAMGLTCTANAATVSAGTTPTIDNIATATYSISGIPQTAVQSNTVTVNITLTAAFSLEAKNADDLATDDFNKNLVVTPNGRVTFNHTLSNSGNIEDEYTLKLVQGGLIAGTTQSASTYDLANTSVTYTIYAADKTVKSSQTVTGIAFENTVIKLLAGETAGISIAAKAKDNVGGYSQNLTLEASSSFLTTNEPAKATLININNSITKVPVFQITSKVSNTLNLNDPSSKATYTITVRNDDRASYAADAKNIVIIDGLPAGLRLADTANIAMVNGNGATIEAGVLGEGTSTANDSVKVTLLNLAKGETVTITFDVQRDANEPLANPKEIINHAFVTLDLTEGEIIHDSTNPADTAQNTTRFYPSTDDSELLTGVTNNAIGGDSAAPLVANQRGLEISSPTQKEIPTSTSTGTQVTHSVVITNNGQEIEGEQAGDIKFTIGSGTDNKVTVVTGSVELVYDDNNPATPNYTYTITRVNGVNDLSTAVATGGAPQWTGMAPGSTVTINYKVESTNAVIDTAEKTTITLIPGGTDAPTIGTRIVQNTTNVKGLKLVKEQALNKTCSDTATLSFTQSALGAQAGECIVYKISAFNDFSNTDSRFSFDNLVISDTIARFNNKATVLSGATDPIFKIRLDDVPDANTAPTNEKYTATLNTTEVSGTVPTLAPQQYAALMFAVKITEKGTITP